MRTVRANADAGKMPDSVSNSVFEARTKVGFTQEELAERVGVSRQTIIAIEKGNYTPSVMLALKIARAFKMCVDDLFHI
jgi:putative transcriptional regulator